MIVSSLGVAFDWTATTLDVGRGRSLIKDSPRRGHYNK